MASLPVKSMSGASKGTIEFPDDLLLLNTDKGLEAMTLAVTAYRANNRQGSASTKGKGEVRGSNKKLWRQKGTGRARMGMRRSPIWRGGGVVWGPKPRDFSKDQNRKSARLAFQRAWTEQVIAERVLVIDDVKVDEPKTKLVAGMLKSLDTEKSVLLVTSSADENLQLACRNLPKLELTSATNVNTYQLLKYQHILCDKEAVETLKNRIAGTSTAPETPSAGA